MSNYRVIALYFSTGKIVRTGDIVRNDDIVNNASSYKIVVNAPKNENVYVYIRNKNNNKVLSYFVRKNSISTMRLNWGKYDVYYALGDKWHGNILLFGPFTKCYYDTFSLDTSTLTSSKWMQTTFEPLDSSIEKINIFSFPK